MNWIEQETQCLYTCMFSPTEYRLSKQYLNSKAILSFMRKKQPELEKSGFHYKIL